MIFFAAYPELAVSGSDLIDWRLASKRHPSAQETDAIGEDRRSPSFLHSPSRNVPLCRVSNSRRKEREIPTNTWQSGRVSLFLSVAFQAADRCECQATLIADDDSWARKKRERGERKSMGSSDCPKNRRLFVSIFAMQSYAFSWQRPTWSISNTCTTTNTLPLRRRPTYTYLQYLRTGAGGRRGSGRVG